MLLLMWTGGATPGGVTYSYANVVRVRARRRVFWVQP
jgi:hypothetical protein